MQSYCQFNEDLFALNFVKNTMGRDRGTFIDIGANDGITGSNSKLLEDQGWSGILVEPNPLLQAELKKNRPNGNIKQVAISNDKEVTFNCVEGEGNLHGLSRIDSSEEFIGHVKKHGGKVIQHTVECKTLTKLIEESELKTGIDFLSVDVEGHELTVLETLDFKTYRPNLVCLEDNSKGECLKCHDFMKQQGYTYIARTGVNDWYCLDQLASAYKLERAKANFTKLRWRTKTRLKNLLGLQKNKSHI
tara:strand:+ start:1138 stop:1878 length:741 start_codon:yes stop_codon:yes gene_type:complete